MHGAFDPHFQIPSGEALGVGGPLLWDGSSSVPPLSPVDTIEFHTVTVTQGTTEVEETIARKPWTRPNNERYDERRRAHWTTVLHLDPGDQFVAGFAEARAVVSVSAGGAQTTEEWVHQIEFVV